MRQTGAVPVHERVSFESPRGHRAYLSAVEKEGFFGGQAEFYLFEVEMVLPKGRTIPLARHEVPIRHILGKIYWEDPGRHISWSKTENAFTLSTDRSPIVVQVPY